jgi:hypothetical protein
MLDLCGSVEEQLKHIYNNMISIPLTLFAVFTVVFVLGFLITIISNDAHTALITLICLIGSFVTMLVCAETPHNYKTIIVPTTITQIVETEKEIIAITPVESFVSTSTQEVFLWKSDTPKIIKTTYNHFGDLLKKELTVVESEK